MHRTIIAFLLVSLSFSACLLKEDKKAEPPVPPACQSEKREMAECSKSLDACIDATGWPSAEAEVPAYEVDSTLVPGAVFNLTRGFETEVMNPTPPQDGIWRFPAGSECVTTADASITVVKREGADILVRYRRAAMPVLMKPCSISTEEAERTKECPNGTLFFIQDEDADKLTPFDDASERTSKARRMLNSEKP